MISNNILHSLETIHILQKLILNITKYCESWINLLFYKKSLTKIDIEKVIEKFYVPFS